MRIKKGDTVLVISGDDRGKMGKVLKIFKEKNRAVVESVNFIKRHTRPSTKNPKGGILEKEGSIEISNLMLYCSKCSSPSKVSYKVLADASMTGEKLSVRKTKVRICRKCGEII
ncbi:MAG: 50S ribosomal protein L24 [candidate division Zixibacteria bacterium]|nr:50S ribosomal protein L24 [candidate division Zixibacteria bacterium]